MSRPLVGRRRLAAGAVCILVLVAAQPGGLPRRSAPAGRSGHLRTTALVQAASSTSPASAAIEDAAAGWRPKQPALCGGAIILTVLAGSLMGPSPIGGLLAMTVMLPVIVDACG